ncbi:MAG: type II secretion system protein GspM [Gammaproteobacteria bacterium]|nr:type II secretion system protein GspM [Gammaproteobacteria bacterium]
MDALKASLQQLTSRINALAVRERALLGAIVFGVIIALGNTFVYQPFGAERKRLNNDISAVQQQIAALGQQIQAIQATRQGLDPNEETRAQLAALKTESDELDKKITRMMEGLIEPAQMAQMLEEALTREPGLKLVRAKNLGAAPLTPGSATAPATPSSPVLYKHGLVIEFEGSYLATLRYLKALEALPWRLFWDGVDLRVQTFPQARITITVHTLSLKEGWIGG